jgi:hypothetical protein
MLLPAEQTNGACFGSGPDAAAIWQSLTAREQLKTDSLNLLFSRHFLPVFL